MAAKRKRTKEAGLSEQLGKWRRQLGRALKLSKGFERQRLSKRVRAAEADAASGDKAERLRREVAVLKSLDLQQAADAHLCASLLRIKAVAESPKLPAEVRPVPRPSLSAEEQVALHNVSSALYSRKQVKDVVEAAVAAVCVALQVPIPVRRSKGKGRGAESGGRREAKDVKEDDVPERADAVSGDDSDDPGPEANGFSGEGDVTDSEAEKAFMSYEALLGNSSDDDSDEDEGGKVPKARLKAIGGAEADDISIASTASSWSGIRSVLDEEDGSEAEDSPSPPPRKKRTKQKPAVETAGSGTFIPALLGGGYISGSGSEASDLDVAPVRKNRRGQRARQALAEKKYKDQAKHLLKKSRDEGWDPKRGAVGGDDGGPWKKGIKSPFASIHPARQLAIDRAADPSGKKRGDHEHRLKVGYQEKPKGGARDSQAEKDTGPLHASWEAAKRAKEQAQMPFMGKKIVFD